MNKFIGNIVSYAIGKAKRNKFIQNIFEKPFNLEKFPRIGEFEDSFGFKHELLNGLRTKIRPGWERMLKPNKTVINKDYLLKQKSNGEIASNKILPIFETMDKNLSESTILEVGCHSGGTSFSLAAKGAKKVIGSEFSGYKVDAVESPNHKTDDKLIEVNDELKKIRNNLAINFKNTELVEFVDDDICNSSLTSNSFDIVCSWEVLEHLHDPLNAFKSMNKILKKGGIIVHEYNPFFCINGGHSLCTLDMLWGHTQLSNTDFERYLEEIRPKEKKIALSFYRFGLNRMTLSDLEHYLKQAEFEQISILPFTKEQHVRMVNKDILENTKRIYPEVTLLDLASPRVYVIAKKSLN